MVDFAIAQPETDAARIGLTGWSFGGVLVFRAAAFEHRLAAVVGDPGFHDNFEPWEELNQQLIDYFGSVTNEHWMELYGSLPARGLPGPSQASIGFLVNKRGEIYGEAFHTQATTGAVIEDVVGLFSAISSYSADADLFGQVTAHALVTSYEDDASFSGAQGAQVAAWLTSAASVTSFEFTAAQGAVFHCAPMAPQFRNEVVFDWLARVFGAPAPQPSPSPSASASTPAGVTNELAASGIDGAWIAPAVGVAAAAVAAGPAIASRSRSAD
jgi:hypothetical protein